MEIAATDSKKAAKILITGVVRYATEVQVKGVKLTRNGQPHPKGVEQTFDVEVGRFLVKWEDAPQAEAVVAAPVELVFE